MRAVREWEREHPAPNHDSMEVFAKWLNMRALAAARVLVALLGAVELHTLEAGDREARLLLACDTDGFLEDHFKVRAAVCAAAGSPTHARAHLGWVCRTHAHARGLRPAAGIITPLASDSSRRVLAGARHGTQRPKRAATAYTGAGSSSAAGASHSAASITDGDGVAVAPAAAPPGTVACRPSRPR
jgi:hypothetical protein